MADEYGVIIVTPDGGGMSFYFDSPLGKTNQFETYISKEAVQYCTSLCFSRRYLNRPEAFKHYMILFKKDTFIIC